MKAVPLRLWREWAAYRRLEPFGDDRADFHAKFVAMYAGGPYESTPSTADFRMPWDD